MKFREVAQKTIPDLAAICGTSMIAIGLHLIYPPAMWIGVGIILLTGGIIGWRNS